MNRTKAKIWRLTLLTSHDNHAGTKTPDLIQATFNMKRQTEGITMGRGKWCTWSEAKRVLSDPLANTNPKRRRRRRSGDTRLCRDERHASPQGSGRCVVMTGGPNGREGRGGGREEEGLYIG